MSEIPYLFACVLSLVLYQRSLAAPGNRLFFILAILVSILPVHIRSIGIAFSVAFIIANIARPRWKYALWHAILLGITSIAFRAATSWNSPYFAQLFQRDSYYPEAGMANFTEIALRVVVNIRQYAIELLASSFYYSGNESLPYFTMGLSLFTVLIILAGWVRAVKAPATRILVLYLPMYFGILFLWQVQWASDRFLAPVLPFLFLLFWDGLTSLLAAGSRGKPFFLHFFNLDSGIMPRWLPVIAWGIGALLSAGNITSTVMQSYREKTPGPDWQNYYAVGDWLRLNAPSGAVVACRKPELLFMRAHRPCVVYPFTYDTDKVIDFFARKNVRYIVADNFFWTPTTQLYVYPAISQNPDLFSVVYELNAPSTYLLEFRAREKKILQ